MTSRTIIVQLHREGAMCFIPVPFDSKLIFGRVRAPVKVTLNNYTFRSTIAPMGGITCIPLRKSNREAAGIDGTETLPVKIELDVERREVKVPTDLQQALASNALAAKGWDALSYTHRREYVDAIESAKKAETRARRVASTVAASSAVVASSRRRARPAV